jgi:DNA modification methylase
MTTYQLITGDAIASLQQLPEKSIQTCITSPPYFGLRDYGVDGQLGLEATPEAYVRALVDVFREVWRVLKDDGTLWLNLGDSYARTGGTDKQVSKTARAGNTINSMKIRGDRTQKTPRGYKEKDLLGIPWTVALALREDGWYLRRDIIWSKRNPMTESVTDRPTTSHEYLFLLSKRPRYYYDKVAIMEPSDPAAMRKGAPKRRQPPPGSAPDAGFKNGRRYPMRNKRSVWTLSTAPYNGAHFATFPPSLVEPCVLAGSRIGDTVLDCFSGSGTTGMVAVRHGREYVGIDLNTANVALAVARIEPALQEWRDRKEGEKQIALFDE